MKQYRRGYVQGTFDLFHVGHLNLLRRAKERCGYLIAGVVSDELNEKYKNKRPFIPYAERAAVVAGCRYVDEVVRVDVGHDDKVQLREELSFDAHFCGDDHGHWDNLVAALRERGCEMVFFPYTEATSSTKIKEELKRRILYHEDDVFSFDIFDTLLTRDVALPVGIFALLAAEVRGAGQAAASLPGAAPAPDDDGETAGVGEKNAAAVPGDAWADLPENVRHGFFDLRIAAERLAREAAQKKDARREDITLDEVYAYLARWQNLTEQQAARLAARERALEILHIRPVPENVCEAESLLAAGRRVILISDMYMDEATLRKMLEKAAPRLASLLIYVSGTCGKTKGSGNLYRYVQHAENISRFHWVHTGDNKGADIDRAAESGIKTVFYNGAALTRRELELMRDHEQDLRLEKAIGAIRWSRVAENTEELSLDGLAEKPREGEPPFGLACRYPTGCLPRRVALYAAGELGRGIYGKLRADGWHEVICWADKNPAAAQADGLPVKPVAALAALPADAYDVLALGVARREVAEEIKQELLALGLPEEKIVWWPRR